MAKKLLAQLLAFTFIAGVFGSLTGCNTMAGAGRDMERGGEKLQDSAQQHKNY